MNIGFAAKTNWVS